MLPSNCQSSGKVWIRAYSLTLNGRVSNGWHRSVCFWHGEQVRVSEGSSSERRLAIPVLPPPRFQLPPIYSLAISSGRSLQSPPCGTNVRTSSFFFGYWTPSDLGASQSNMTLLNRASLNVSTLWYGDGQRNWTLSAMSFRIAIRISLSRFWGTWYMIALKTRGSTNV